MRAITASLVWQGDRFEDDLAVVLDGSRIASVLPRGRVPEDAVLDDWGQVALIPGLVNAHGHAFQNLLKGFADDRPFDEWRDAVLYPFSERLDGSAIYAGALFAFAESLLAGTTTTVDFFYLHDGANDNALQVIAAARALGIRLVFARAFYDPAAPTNAPARYREPAKLAAERCRSLWEALSDDPLVSVQPAPHSLHAAAPETIRVALELAAELGTPCHLHLAEARYERDLISRRYGLTPVRLLHKEGLLDPSLVTIHTVWADDDELDLLADGGAGVVHCPGANGFLGDGMARVPEMLERGISVALGPDGGCANNRQSVLDEMRLASLLAKARLLDGAALDAPTAFRLGTASGAQLLGIDAGAIVPGQFADLVALALDDLSLHPLPTIDRQMVHSMQPTAIARVMVGGEVVVERGRLTRVEHDEIAALVSEATRNWTRPEH
jgi:5-methylthioadenosine/S-adenosylhomocysteine deaminase